VRPSTAAPTASSSSSCYIGHGTGPEGPFAIRGLDRVRTRNGVVVENVIRYDPVEIDSAR
jgi:hypothetical protein